MKWAGHVVALCLRWYSCLVPTSLLLLWCKESLCGKNITVLKVKRVWHPCIGVFLEVCLASHFNFNGSQNIKSVIWHDSYITEHAMRGYNIHLSLKETASLYVSLITCLLLGEEENSPSEDKVLVFWWNYRFLGGRGWSPRGWLMGWQWQAQYTTSQIV